MKKFTLFVISGLIACMFIGNIQAQNIKIAVIADIHYFDPELIINDGAAFQTYV